MTQETTDPGTTASASALRLVDLRSTELDPVEVLAAVADPAAGGVNLFSGLVRNHDHGVAVDRLEYVAHPTAVDRLREVAAAVVAEFDVIAVAAVHRTGTLVIGDVAVLVACSAAHRDTAYVASRALIDRLKDEVPIWKHQILADGTDEWVTH